MAASAHVYGLALKSLAAAQINFTGSTAKGMLLTSAYSPNQDTHQFKSDLSGETSGTGYTAGGVALASKTATYAAGSNTLTLSCANLVWATATITARYLVFYMDTGTSTTSALIAYVDFGSDVTSTGGSFTYPVPVAGIAQFVAA